MRNFISILIAIFFLLLTSCSSNKEKIDIIEEEDIELQMIDAYKEGLQALEEGDVLFAANKASPSSKAFKPSS